MDSMLVSGILTPRGDGLDGLEALVRLEIQVS